MKFIKYLITICKPQKKKYVSSMTIDKIIDYLTDNSIYLKYGKWERHGKYKQLHYHGIFIIPDTMRYKTFTNIGGYRCHFEYIKDTPINILRCKRYIDKHYNKYTHNQIDTHLTNYYQYHYGFAHKRKSRCKKRNILKFR